MIAITGAAGFIGSCLVAHFNQKGITNLILVDDFSHSDKNKNIAHHSFDQQIERIVFLDWLKENGAKVSHLFHLGARTDTAEKDTDLFNRLNLHYSQAIWQACVQHQIPLVYASSAATYGDGQLGFEDRHDLVFQLQALNPYGLSKNEFDKWVLQSSTHPPFWAGLKFFNVYGPNEFHKDRMSSVIKKAFYQIKEKGQVKLFRSHHPNYIDGEQYRDFVYVKDIVAVCDHLMFDAKAQNALYNVGTGKARTFLDLAYATFKAMDKTPKIEFIDIPIDIRAHYQYFTEAKMDKLRQIGNYSKAFYNLEDGIEDYVQNYLAKDIYW